MLRDDELEPFPANGAILLNTVQENLKQQLYRIMRAPLENYSQEYRPCCLRYLMLVRTYRFWRIPKSAMTQN